MKSATIKICFRGRKLADCSFKWIKNRNALINYDRGASKAQLFSSAVPFLQFPLTFNFPPLRSSADDLSATIMNYDSAREKFRSLEREAEIDRLVERQSGSL